MRTQARSAAFFALRLYRAIRKAERPQHSACTSDSVVSHQGSIKGQGVANRPGPYLLLAVRTQARSAAFFAKRLFRAIRKAERPQHRERVHAQVTQPISHQGSIKGQGVANRPGPYLTLAVWTFDMLRHRN